MDGLVAFKVVSSPRTGHAEQLGEIYLLKHGCLQGLVTFCTPESLQVPGLVTAEEQVLWLDLSVRILLRL